MKAIVPARTEHLAPWGEMRAQLWPDTDAEMHAQDAAGAYLQGKDDRIALIALDDAGLPCGFAEADLRHDYVEGCDTSPVAFLEGIFVTPSMRNHGIARALATAVADWGRARGCSEFASNALLDNSPSHAFHAAVGFEETERVVYFRRML